jgi:hypothetical protein
VRSVRIRTLSSSTTNTDKLKNVLLHIRRRRPPTRSKSPTRTVRKTKEDDGSACLCSHQTVTTFKGRHWELAEAGQKPSSVCGLAEEQRRFDRLLQQGYCRSQGLAPMEEQDPYSVSLGEDEPRRKPL